jgi:hypothetical protein
MTAGFFASGLQALNTFPASTPSSQFSTLARDFGIFIEDMDNNTHVRPQRCRVVRKVIVHSD